MSELYDLLIQRKTKKKKIVVKNPKEIIFYFLDVDGDRIIKGYAFGVDIKKLHFIKKYSFWYCPFAKGGLKMFEWNLKWEFAKIGATLGSLEDYRVYLNDKYNLYDDTPTNGFKYEIIKRKKKINNFP